MSDHIYVIYKHTCIITGKSYIGQTNDLDRRTLNHKKPSSGCTAFRNAIQKYGWDSFTTEILVDNLSVDDANVLEQKLIIEHNTLAPTGYNLTLGGDNYVRTIEHRAKISESVRDYKAKHPVSDATRKKMSDAQRARIRKPLSEETKRKISEAKKGIVPTKETRDRISKSHQGKKGTTTGRKQSAETIAKRQATKLKKQLESGS